jgi:hypothetical protein
VRRSSQQHLLAMVEHKRHALAACASLTSFTWTTGCQVEKTVA